MIMLAEKYCEIALAAATPATSRLQTITKKQVQDNIDHTGNRQIPQRPPRVSDRTEYCITEIVNGKGRHSQKIDSDIEHGSVDQFRLRIQNLQNAFRKEHSNQHDQNTGCQTQKRRRMNSLSQTLFIFCSVVQCRQHIDSSGHTDQKSCEHRDQDRR